MTDASQDPERRLKFDAQSLAKLFHSWPGMDYNISSCKLVRLSPLSVGVVI